MGKNIYQSRELIFRGVSGSVVWGRCVAVAPYNGDEGRLSKSEVVDLIAVLAKWLAGDDDAPSDEEPLSP